MLSKIRKSFGKSIINTKQIRTLLWKDFLVRIRQPWMTLLQYVWPIFIFSVLYYLRLNYVGEIVEDCQFPTRHLPGKYQMLPFIQSCICTIDNKCMNTTEFEETSKFDRAPLTPVLNLVQTFINEPLLMEAVVNIPREKNVLSAATKIYSHKKFQDLLHNVNIIRNKVPEFVESIGISFDINKLWSDDSTFASIGKGLCGRPFEITPKETGWLQNIIPKTDDTHNQVEIDSMPTPYCKQLYRDVAISTTAKMTWNVMKPFIQGKIVYGPSNAVTDEIMSRATALFEDIRKLQHFVGALNQISILLRTDNDFRSHCNTLLQWARSPFIQRMLVSYKIDIDTVEKHIQSLLIDDLTVATTLQTIVNILECLSTDRLVRVTTEAEMEQRAFELYDKKMFYGAVYFKNVSRATDREYSYKIRMDVENVPTTLRNRNRFWFPGPNANFDGGMKYHRGFIQLQYFLDQAIIKTVQHHEKNRRNKKQIELLTLKYANSRNNSVVAGVSTETKTVAKEAITVPVPVSLDLPSFKFNDLFGPEQKEFHVDEFEMYTKQFPHPKYKEDVFVIGAYMAQGMQLAFFFALVVQVAASVRQRIWTKESGNSTLMLVMGLRKSSEHLSWIITNIVELFLFFTICLTMMYIGEMLLVTKVAFLIFFLIVYGLCFISFCYMISTFFSSATIGSVSAIVLLYFTYLPYIVVVAHDVELTFASKFVANLSFSTAFCYAWRHIMRYELQQKDLSFGNAFSGSTSTNGVKFGLFMLLLDTVLYAIIGYLYERFAYSDFKFYNVPVKEMDINIGGLLRNVTKTFDGKKPAVDDVSIVFRRNNVTCLLGRNGAGKSTIIKLLTGQVQGTSGEIYLPQNLDRISGKEYKERIGLCPQNNVLIPKLTAKEHLELYANIKAHDRYGTALAEIMKSLHFGKHLNFKCEKLSGGYKRRLLIAIAFIDSPNLVILDEPCSGVDDKARKTIWQLIGDIRKDRAVILSTHHLDEAEYLGDNVFILKDGRVVSEKTSNMLKNQFTKSFDIRIKLDAKASHRQETIDVIKANLETHSPNFSIIHQTNDDYHINVPYHDVNNEYIDFGPLIKSIEKLHQQRSILHFGVISKDLTEMFNSTTSALETLISSDTNHSAIENVREWDKSTPTNDRFDSAKNLLLKRFHHFKRNYRFILLILIVPAIFQIIAMTCVVHRPPSEFDSELVLSQQMYANSTEFFAYQNLNKFANKARAHLKCHDKCEYFNSSEQAFHWILETHDDFISCRYGGVTLNDSKLVVWYNNKGYHALPVYLNELNSALFKSEMDNDAYKITTSSHPLNLEWNDLSLSSVLQQIADCILSMVIFVSFSLVVTSSAVYIVNERVSGEKLQQRLCNVTYRTYWGVAFLWDFSFYLIALLIGMGIFKAYDIPIYTANDNLYGTGLLIFMYGFAMIPMVYLMEKLFYDASMAYMYILCLNVVISFSNTILIMLFDIVGKSNESRMVRNVLNKLLLVFPQHALLDGLTEICKNHITADIFARYDMHIYKSPIGSTLLLPHIFSSLIFGLVFMALNYLIENNHIHRFRQWIQVVLQRNKVDDESVLLTVVSKYQTRTEGEFDLPSREDVLVVKNLCKTYGSKHQVLDNVSFNIADGECFGLLGTNGAGKSTIFSILSGRIHQSSGFVELLDEKGISYCPQTNALDDFLTVEEVIHFYGRLRKIPNIEHLTTKTLKSFHLEQYRNVLVKNLSGGNRRKLSVAVACFGNNRLVLMDEPTSDTDPVTRALVYKTINSLIAAKRSIILTSHAISEIEQVCHRIGVMRAGKMIAIDSPLALKERFGLSYVVKVYYNGSEPMTIERYLLENLAYVDNLTIHSNCLKFSIKVGTSQCTNSDGANSENCIPLSNLFRKLYTLTKERKIAYTISECGLDQLFQQVLDNESNHTYINPSFEKGETQLQSV